MADFKIQRGTSTIATTTTQVTITAGSEYTAPASASSAFIKIVASTNGGNRNVVDSNTTEQASEASIDNGSNILTSVTFTRYGAHATIPCLIEWEIIEYTGMAGGANEFIVRAQTAQALLSSEDTVTTGAVSGVVTDADMVVWITGQRGDSASNQNNHGQYISAWNSGGDTITFTRSRSSVLAGVVSYAAIEFTGSNWVIQYVAKTSYAAADTQYDVTITAVGSITKTFLHLQHCMNGDTCASDGHRVWISSTTQVSFILAASAVLTAQQSVAWVIENTQSTGTPMVTAQYTGSTATNGTVTNAITAVAATNNTSVEQCCATLPQASTSFAAHVASFKLTSTTNVDEYRSRTLNTLSYRFATVEWPTVASSVTTEYVGPIYRQTHSPMIGRRYV